MLHGYERKDQLLLQDPWTSAEAFAPCLSFRHQDEAKHEDTDDRRIDV